MSIAGRLRRALLGISGEEARFLRRGFPSSHSAAQTRLETAGRTFIAGYNLALAQSDADLLADQLDRRTEEELSGFAYEGAAMGLALVDWLSFPRLARPLRRWSQFT